MLTISTSYVPCQLSSSFTHALFQSASTTSNVSTCSIIFDLSIICTTTTITTTAFIYEASSACLECGWGFSPVLNSSFHTYKKIEDEIPEETRITRSIKSDKEIVLKIEISPKGKKSFISTEALLDSGAKVVFIDRKWARDKNIPLTLL